MKKAIKKDQNVEKRREGRPSLWVNPEVVKKMVDEYFENEKEPTLAGLAYSLGISRASLYNYAQKDEFIDIIKDARARVMKLYEKRLIYSTTPTGVIFALKNMGWKDRTDMTTNDKDIPAPIYGGKSTV